MVNSRENRFPEHNETEQFSLNRLLGENFSKEKTIELDRDVDANNQPVLLKDQKLYWTELINPETGKGVEAKVYLPKDQLVRKIFLVSPGYRGDFVLQENDYAQGFAKDNRAVVFLRHNGIKLDNRTSNYIHCPQKEAWAKKEGQEYLGGGAGFDVEEANQEVATALLAFSGSLENLERVDVLGHSWGARIGLLSLKKMQERADQDPIAAKMLAKVKSLVMLGPWLEARSEVFSEYREYLEQEAKEDWFLNFKADKVLQDFIASGQEISGLSENSLPKEMKLVGIQSVGDPHVDYQEEYEKFFSQMKNKKNKGSVVVKKLEGIMPEVIGGRETESHDYAAKQIRDWVGQIIN